MSRSRLRLTAFASPQAVALLSLVSALVLALPAVADQSLAVRLADLDSRVSEAPSDIQVRLVRAELRHGSGMPIEALADLAVVALHDPDEPRMLLIRAEILSLLGSEDLALQDLDRRIAKGPVSARAHGLRSRLRERSGAQAGALQDAQAALRLAPSPERALSAARLVGATRGLGEAGRVCADAASTLGGAVALRLEAVRYFRASGLLELALEQLGVLLRASPEHPDWLLLQAEVLDQAARPAEALASRRRALARLDELLTIRPTRARRDTHSRLTSQLQEGP